MIISYWIKDECVLSLGDLSLHPLVGDDVRLDLQDHKGYYRVAVLMWSFRHIPITVPGRCHISDHRLEIHLEAIIKL